MIEWSTLALDRRWWARCLRCSEGAWAERFQTHPLVLEELDSQPASHYLYWGGVTQGNRACQLSELTTRLTKPLLHSAMITASEMPL